MQREVYYTYIVCCRDETLYTGWTTNLEARIRKHNMGTGARYTRSRRPVALVYYEIFESRHEAMSREAKIKHMNREEKLQLIRRFEGTIPPRVSDSEQTGSEKNIRFQRQISYEDASRNEKSIEAKLICRNDN